MPLFFSNRMAFVPGPHEDDDIRAGVDFCLSAGLTDLCVFIAGEEANSGFLTPEELEGWLPMCLKAKAAAHRAGLTFSVNPWNTLLHGDRGRQLKPGQNFQRMVDRDGRQASAVACPLSEAFQAWLLEHYTRVCAALQPHTVWVEDDLRLHNHLPLRWGGCFCPLHMQAYADKLGRRVEREAFVQSLLKPGAPEDCRMAWLDVHRETIVGLAEVLGEAIAQASPDTRVGLMSSMPRQHCAEGRDWERVLRALAGTHPPLNRIHLPAYSDMAPGPYMRAFNELSLCVRAMNPPETRVLPEIENYPHSRFSKSAAFTRFQLESMAPLRVDGVTLDLFDIGGGGIMPEEGYRGILLQSHRFLEQVNASGVFAAPFVGVSVPVCTRSSYTLHTPYGQQMEELYPNDTFWGGLLGAFGVPIVYTVDALPSEGIVALAGQVLRNYSEDEIRGMFASCRVLMNGEAAFVLCQMGLGALAGIQSVVHHPDSGGVASYEQVSDGTRYFGIIEARCSAQDGAGGYYAVTYDRPAETYSVVCGPAGGPVGPGTALYDGRVTVLPFGGHRECNSRLYHPLRQAFVQRALAAMGCPLFVRDGRDLFVYACEQPDGNLGLYLVNASNDACPSAAFHLGGRRIRAARLLGPEGERQLRPEGDRLPLEMPAMSCALVTLQCEGVK